MCYEVDVNEVRDGEETSENLNIGLAFLVDNNVERFLHLHQLNHRKEENKFGFLNNFVRLEETDKTLVYINSLGRLDFTLSNIIQEFT